jgi:hypothetical protein
MSKNWALSSAVGPRNEATTVPGQTLDIRCFAAYSVRIVHMPEPRPDSEVPPL